MDALIKWIGGATAAVALGFSGAAVVTGAVFDRTADHPGGQRRAQGLAAPKAAASRTALTPARKAAPAPEQPFTVKRILPIEGAIKYGEWHWDDAKVPEGPIVMTVDLDARVLSVFKGGYEIGAAAVLVGTDEYPTPLGTFPILAKQRHNKSEKYGGAPMPWSMFLTGDGVAIHGGHVVENGYASHGCISGPDAFVSKIFAVAKPGDKVIITRGATMKMGDPIV